MRYLIVDQIFHIDSETNEPVLMVFVRIKKSSDFTVKKKKKQIETRVRAEDISGVLAPQPIPIPIPIPIPVDHR